MSIGRVLVCLLLLPSCIHGAGLRSLAIGAEEEQTNTHDGATSVATTVEGIAAQDGLGSVKQRSEVDVEALVGLVGGHAALQMGRQLYDLPLINSLMVPRLEAARLSLDTPAQPYVWSALLLFLMDMHVFCPAATIASKVVTGLLPPQPHGMFTQAVPHASPTQALKDLRGQTIGGEASYVVHQSVVAQEMAAYYFHFRMLISFNGHTWRQHSEPLLDPLAVGWVTRKIIYRDVPALPADMSGVGVGGGNVSSPLLAILTKGQEAIVLVRGTVYAEEWAENYKYELVEEQEARRYFAGRVHRGSFETFAASVGQLEQELRVLRAEGISKVTVSGYSLGGMLAMLYGLHLGKTIFSDTQVDVVTVAAAVVGDESFVHELAHVVNARHLRYVGEGHRHSESDGHDLYLLGDFAGEISSFSLPLCDKNGHRTGDWSHYRPTYNNVHFQAHDLPNPQGFRLRSDILSPLSLDPLVPHVCAYWCWLARAVGDPKDRCFFEEDAAVGLVPDDRSALCLSTPWGGLPLLPIISPGPSYPAAQPE